MVQVLKKHSTLFKYDTLRGAALPFGQQDIQLLPHQSSRAYAHGRPPQLQPTGPWSHLGCRGHSPLRLFPAQSPRTRRHHRSSSTCSAPLQGSTIGSENGDLLFKIKQSLLTNTTWETTLPAEYWFKGDLFCQHQVKIYIFFYFINGYSKYLITNKLTDSVKLALKQRGQLWTSKVLGDKKKNNRKLKVQKPPDESNKPKHAHPVLLSMYKCITKS